MIVKTCRCGKRYTAAEWEKLHYVGVMGDDVERIELRDCTCGSTVAVVLTSKEPKTE